MRDPILFAPIPNCGSTILLDALCQHPQVFSEGTSPMARGFGVMRSYYSNNPEVISHRHRNQEQYGERIWESMRMWFGGHFSPLDLPDDTVVVDKGRAWLNHADAIRPIWPASRILVMVRNPLNCWASCVRQDLGVNAFLTDGAALSEETAKEKLRFYFRDDGPQEGPLGYACKRIESILEHGPRRYPNVMFVSYEDFMESPLKVLRKLALDLELDDFDGWDLERVEAVTSTDIDASTNHKWNHTPLGTVRPVKASPTDWVRMGACPPLAGLEIAKRYPALFNRWGYDQVFKSNVRKVG